MACIVDTASINLTISAAQLSADLIVDPGAGLSPNPLVVNPTGVYVVGSDGWIPLPTTLAFSSADGHTFVATTSADLRSFIGLGDKIRLVQSGVPGYFIVTAIAAGTITLYGGTDYVLAATPVTLPYFSKVKSPIGFPLAPTKWTEQFRDTTQRTQASPVNGTWYNPGSPSLAIPIGVWDANYEFVVYQNASSGDLLNRASLSTANNAESDTDLTTYAESAPVTRLVASMARRKTLTLLVKTTYFFVAQVANASATSLTLINDPTGAAGIINARSAYL